MKNREPIVLRTGKAFHYKIQCDWEATASGSISREENVRLLSGRNGRIDVFVKDSHKYVCIGEIKNSDWDKMTSVAVQRNVRRQIRQTWKYVDAQLHLHKDVTPGVIFPRRPKDLERLHLIEKLFESEAIAVVWDDESINERKARS